MKKIKVGLVFGGKSGEHEVSVRSAESIKEQLIKSKRIVKDIYINKDGVIDLKLIKECDVIFLFVYGSFGEDGCLQGMLEMLDKPYVGAGVLGSAVGMDKEIQKRLLIQAGIPVAKYHVLNTLKSLKMLKSLKYPVFVKPANAGSSVGVGRVNKIQELENSLKKAFKYDTKVLIEEAVEGRELEISVLGNENPIASVPGEVIPQGKHEFYDYEAKYLDEKGALLVVPAAITNNQISITNKLAIKVFKVLGCEGMARVDMFLKKDGTIIVNEINTLPGFTNISMYPKLWEASGLSYPKLLERLIDLALERKMKKDKLKRSY